MAILTVEGIYKDGEIELAERPELAGATARVLVTFLPAPTSPAEPDPGAAGERAEPRRQAFARMREGIPFGGPPYPKREELHDRHG